MSRRRKARILALQIIYQHDTGSGPLGDIFRNFWQSQEDHPDEIRHFAEESVRGVMDHLETIDNLTRKYSDHWDLERMAVVDRNILRLAVHELLYRKDIPPKVTINEYVEIAKKFSAKESSAFVNGILDRVYRENPDSRS